MHLLESVRACQSLGPLKTFNNVKLCQFSEYLVLAALFLLVEGAMTRPRIHLPTGTSSSRSEKAMKYWPFADFWVPMVWSKVVCPGADSVMKTDTVSGRDSMLIRVPSGDMSCPDWLSRVLVAGHLVVGLRN